MATGPTQKMWLCVILGEQLGPMTFQDLAEMAEKGMLSKSDKVRSQGSEEWKPAGLIQGLFNATSTQPAEHRPANRTAGQAGYTQARIQLKHQKKCSVFERFQSFFFTLGELISWGGKPLYVGAGLLSGSGLVLYFIYFSGDSAFPSPHLERLAKNNTFPAERPPRPKVPSIPGLKLRTPKIVPGFKGIEPVHTPWLSQDLKTIVFAGDTTKAKKAQLDLFISRRDNIQQPFEKPQLITQCKSKYYEEYPTLSPDGLELIFVRFTPLPELWYASRISPDDEFSKPELWDVPGLDSEHFPQGVLAPQFIDSQNVKIRKRGKKPGESAVFVVTRSSRESKFSAPKPHFFQKKNAFQFIVYHNKRTYYGWDQGLFVAFRPSDNHAFGTPARIANRKLLGPVDGTVWISPKEDIAFYISPGPNKKKNSQKKLWMVRF